ncbi:unnamed protein product [Amoebophrya sp. A25]|nr:unnamed protein product [Amoebophrya sp. A25]|eukprot:GSA25T00003229001.1
MTVSDIAAMEVEAQEKVAETKEVEAKEVEGKEVEAKEVEEASPASPDSEMKDAAEDQEGEKDGKESADDSDAANKESNDDEEKVESPAKEEDEEEKEPEVEEDNGERDEKLEDDKEEDLFPYGTQVLNDWDRTFNAMSAENKTSLTSIQADGFNNLFAGMRGTVGFHSGRYYFEIKMLDHPRMVRVGFSTLTDDLSLDSSTAFLFDSMGDVVSQGVRQKAVNPRWSRTDVVGVLLNVSMKTVTLYLNGTKTPTGQVTSLPDSMFENGKLKAALYPAIASKGSAVECNFSRKVWKDLPFKTRMVGCGRKADAVLSTKKRHSEISAEDAANTTVEVTIPVGFDSTALVEEYKKDHPDAWVLTGSELALWGEKSGLAKRGQQRGQEKWGVGCLDAPMSVFPMLLKGGNKYLMSLNTMHNLHPSQRADVMAKLRHALNVKINALVCVNSVVDVLENKKPVPQQVRDYYEHVKLPSEDEGWSSIKYSYTGEENLTQEEMGVMVNEKFTAWKKDCKLKSKVSDLRKSTYYQSQLAKFAKLKQLQHKTTAETARKNHVAQQQKMLLLRNCQRLWRNSRKRTGCWRC